MTILDFKNDRKRIIAGGAALVLLLALIFFSENNFLKDDSRMAQILQIETELLKKWQETGRLKNNLGYASSGKEVVLLQKMLAQDTVAYPEKKITGYYGDSTRQAVLNFQKEYELKETGEVDEATRDKLNEIFFLTLCPESPKNYPDFSLKKILTDSPLPLDYVPATLQDVSKEVRTNGVICLKDEAATNVKKMFQDAERDGVRFMITSGYRRPEIQQYLYDFWLKTEGDEATQYIARPGFSEHQLGTAVDLTDASIDYAGVSNKFALSKGGLWLLRNADRYGFAMSFPRHKKDKTGFSWEPWHWRFVGTETAKKMKNEGKIFNEMVLNDGLPVFKGGEGINLSAEAFVSVFATNDGREKILIEKNRNEVLPIASVTKLMTAVVAHLTIKDDEPITMSDTALKNKGNSGIYLTGDTFLFKDALQAMLVASQNEMADAIAERTGKEDFVGKMNETVKKLGLTTVRFVNASGIDPETGSEEMNVSTAYDVYRLVRFIAQENPDIFEITRKNSFRIFDATGELKENLANTNKLLDDGSIPFEIIGGKTGETARAKKNLVMVNEAPCGGKIISVVLGSQDNFADMKSLLKYIDDSYSFACL